MGRKLQGGMMSYSGGVNSRKIRDRKVNFRDGKFTKPCHQQVNVKKEKNAGNTEAEEGFRFGAVLLY
jgi:hypothetical protein